MNEEEKAKELVDKFKSKLGYYGMMDVFFEQKEEAKQCAQICVNEIILALYNSKENFDWQKVELQIDKL